VVRADLLLLISDVSLFRPTDMLCDYASPTVRPVDFPEEVPIDSDQLPSRPLMEERIVVVIAPIDSADHLFGGTISVLVAKTLNANPSLDSLLETCSSSQRPKRAVPGVMWILTDRALQD
jgi:hypothetical protein